MKNDNIKGWMENCMRDFIFKTEYKNYLHQRLCPVLHRFMSIRASRAFLSR